jgi:hypothetical protein
MKRAGVVVVVGLFVLGSTALSGCGGGSSTDASAQQLESARREGEVAARERAQIKNLQHQIRHLKKEVHKRHPATVVVAESGEERPRSELPPSTDSKTFHAPSGNVSCQISADSALCSVASIAETFVLETEESGRLESGILLPRGAGELAPYGSTITVGSVVCSIPESDEPHGISCSDNATGHGFEASSVPARQNTY